MIRISLSYVYQLAMNLEPVGSLPSNSKLNDIIYRLYVAERALNELLYSSLFSQYLRISAPSGVTLLNKLNLHLRHPDLEKIVSQYEIVDLVNSLNEYRISLQAELASLNAYFVARKSAYDTSSLLHQGESMFPPQLASKVPEAISDAREAAKSLAFELNTAAGFHAFRALECVIRRYHSHATGGMAPPRVRNIGIYIKALEASGNANTKIIETLRQIAALHRNPLIHPDVALGPDEANSIIGVVQSAISAILNELPVPQPTTLSALGEAMLASRQL